MNNGMEISDLFPIESLYSSCLRYIKANLEDVLLILRRRNFNLNALFAGFPPAVCEDLLYRADNIQGIISYLFRFGIRNVDLSFYPHNFSIENIENCKTIVFMSLDRSKLSEENLNILISHLHNISILILYKTKTTDEILESIGRICNLLEKLDVSWCPITDLGLFRLCYDTNQQKVRCKHLKILRILYTKTTWKGLLYVLTHKKLWYLDADFDSYITCLNHYIQFYSHRNLHLRNAPVYAIQGPIKVMDILACTPYLTKLQLTYCPISDEDLIGLQNFNYLRALEIKNELNSLSPDGLMLFLSVSGKQLIYLSISNFEHVNLFSVGALCRKLKYFTLNFINKVIFRKETKLLERNGQVIFEYLKTLSLLSLKEVYWTDIHDNLEDLRELTRIRIYFCNPVIPKDILYTMIDRISNLELISIITKTNVFTDQCIQEIHKKINSTNPRLSFIYKVLINVRFFEIFE